MHVDIVGPKSNIPGAGQLNVMLVPSIGESLSAVIIILDSSVAVSW